MLEESTSNGVNPFEDDDVTFLVLRNATANGPFPVTAAACCRTARMGCAGVGSVSPRGHRPGRRRLERWTSQGSGYPSPEGIRPYHQEVFAWPGATDRTE